MKDIRIFGEGRLRQVGIVQDSYSGFMEIFLDMKFQEPQASNILLQAELMYQICQLGRKVI